MRPPPEPQTVRVRAPRAEARRWSSCRRPQPRPAAGFSLLELLLVMAVVGLVLGAGLGAFAALDFSTERAPERVRAVLRAAQAQAAASGWPASVELVQRPDLAPELVLRSARPVGTWQFEDRALVEGVRGQAFADPRGIAPVLDGAERIDDGYLGQGVSLAGAGRSPAVRFDLSQDSLFDPAEGFGLSLRVLHTEPQGAGRLLDVGGSVGLELRPGGALLAWVTPWITSADGRELAGGRVQLVTGESVLPLGRWVELRLAYDRTELRLSVDGVPVAALDLELPLAPLAGPLVLGGEPAAAPLAVDALSWSVVQVSEGIALGQSFEWPAGAPQRLRFGPDGGLDPRRHPAPVRLELLGSRGRMEVVTVGRLGGLSVEVLDFTPLDEEGP